MMPKNAANSAANAPTNPNCVGENVSPQLSWTGVPEGTKSFVMLMIDPEGRGGAGVNHWVAYGIPASVTGFAQGEVSKPSDKYVGGKSTQGVGFYSRPLHAARHHAAPLHVRSDRHRLRSEGTAARSDQGRSDREDRAGGSARARQRLGGAGRAVRQSMEDVSAPGHWRICLMPSGCVIAIIDRR